MPRLDRRQFLSLAAAGAALPAITRAAGRDAPNIVFILADDLGYADLSCYGRRDIATPRIDSLAADGVRFTQGYANSAVCSATRIALITGRYQYRLRAGLEEPITGNTVGLPPSHPTLPSLLKKAGYRTALLGKWHLGSLPHFGPLQSGYERFFGFRGGGVDYFTHADLAHKPDLWDGDEAVEAEGYLTDLLGDRAVGLIGDYAQGRAPFFMSLHFNAPHWPWEAPGDEAESRRLAQVTQRNLWHFDGGSLQTYRKMVERLDWQVGRVLDALRARDLQRNTIVVFSSDNGGERFSDTWPFSGRKTELLEGGLRVPTLIRWPERLPAGRVSEQVAISMDWLPTLLGAAGSAVDPAFPADGRDLLPGLTTSSATPVPRKLFWRYKANAQRASRDGDFKILKIGGNSFLFNVVDDPLERTNLRERRRDVYERMVREWNAWNETMLPELREANSGGSSGPDYADRYGAARGTGEPDATPWPAATPAK